MHNFFCVHQKVYTFLFGFFSIAHSLFAFCICFHWETFFIIDIKKSLMLTCFKLNMTNISLTMACMVDIKLFLLADFLINIILIKPYKIWCTTINTWWNFKSSKCWKINELGENSVIFQRTEMIFLYIWILLTDKKIFFIWQHSFFLFRYKKVIRTVQRKTRSY